MSSRQLGADAAIEAIEQRRPLFPLVEATRAARDFEALGAILGMLTACIDACVAGGIPLTLESAKAREVADALPMARRLLLQSLATRGDAPSMAVIAELCGAVDAVAPRLQMTRKEPPPPETPRREVQLVRVVGMPARETELEVERDDAGDIRRTRHRSRDKEAAQAA
jgi:hypothetical protein